MASDEIHLQLRRKEDAVLVAQLLQKRVWIVPREPV